MMDALFYIFLGLCLSPLVLFYSMCFIYLTYGLYYIFSKYTNLFDEGEK